MQVSRQHSRKSSTNHDRRTNANEPEKIDAHHCNCFFNISKEDDLKLYQELIKIGAYDQKLQENHGQKWALTYACDDFWQLHIKMMPDRHIECEIEPRIRYLEHQTVRSKPAHQEMRQLLEKMGIKYAFITPIPGPCNNRILNTPNNPTDLTQLTLGFAIALFSVAVVITVTYLAKKRANTANN